MNDDKIAKWQALVAARPGDELALFALARALFDAGRTAEARERFAEVLQQKSDWMMAAIFLARCQIDLAEPDAARATLLRARELAVAQGHTDPQFEIDELLEELDA